MTTNCCNGCVLAALLVAFVIPNCFAADCQWTSCVSKSLSRTQICKNRSLGAFTGGVRVDGCREETERVECCKSDSTFFSDEEDNEEIGTTVRTQECKWTSLCWGVRLRAKTACNRDFGSNWAANGDAKRDNCGLYRRRVQCCRK
ncbi:unnamed protein product [Orchesella dallaii]|uniref:Uncharacterized protein n=1 Tax=Orchesella dallaii TaxID=48710 RepID=A0ABP1R6X1_9HEXA